MTPLTPAQVQAARERINAGVASVDPVSLERLERALTPSPRAGFYWAKWRIADEGTPPDLCMGTDAQWEVVGVFENHINDGEPDQYRVSLTGVSGSQSFENFYWGAHPIQKLHPPEGFRTAAQAHALIKGEG